MIEAELPDDTILEFPDGTDQNVVQGAVKKYLAGNQAAQPEPTAQQTQPTQKELPSLIEKVGSAAGGLAMEGMAGFNRYMFGLLDFLTIDQVNNIRALMGDEAIPTLQQALTPKKGEFTKGTIAEGLPTEIMATAGEFGAAGLTGQGLLKQAAKQLTPTAASTGARVLTQAAEQGTAAAGGLGAVSGAGSEVGRELGGETGALVGAVAAPLLMMKALGGLKTGSILIDQDGRPSIELRKALKTQGLEFETLTPEAKALIPKKLDPTLLPLDKTAVNAAEKALVQQIKTGGRDGSLAGLKLSGDKVVPDKIALAATKQGFREGTVQAVKTSSQATKQKMRQMLNNMRAIKADESLDSSLRPSNVAGESVLQRLTFIKSKTDLARQELNQIAKTKLRGQSLDTAPMLNKLESSLDDLGVRLVGDGVPVPDFKGSLISKDKATQRAIKDAIDLMAEGGRPDALRFHNLKRQLDNMIDFKKKDVRGLSGAGERVLKGLRSELNTSLRDVNPDYARVNDVLSKSMQGFDNLQAAAGKSIDIMGEGGEKALGTRLRSLMSNQQNRVNLENSLNEIDDLAKSLGGKFQDSPVDLARFANALDDRFGATAKTSLRGDIEAANIQTIKDGVPRTMFEAATKIGEKGFEKLRGVNDFNAFNAMDELLKGAK